MLPLHHSPNRRTGQVFMRSVHTGQQGDVCRRVPSRKARPDKLVCAGHAWSSSSVRSIASTALGSVRSSLLENGARSLLASVDTAILLQFQQAHAALETISSFGLVPHWK